MINHLPLKLAVIGNCQVGGIASALKVLLPDSEIVAWHVGTSPITKEDIWAKLPEYDVVMSGIIDSEQGETFDRRRLEERCARTVFMLPVVFTGFHPDCVYIGHGGQPISGVVGPYHSAIIAAAFSLGLPPERVPRLFNALVYSKLGYLDAFAAAKRAFLEEHRNYGFDLADHFERWVAADSFMHTINHPRIDVLSTLATLMAVRAGLIGDEKPIPTAVVDDLERHQQWPIYPEIAATIGITASMTFLRSVNDLKQDQSREVELGEAIRASYDTYAKLPDVDLSVGRVGFVRDRLSEMLGPTAARKLSARPPQADFGQFAMVADQSGANMIQTIARPNADDSRAARLAIATSASDAQEFQRAAEQWDALRADFPNEPLYWCKAGEAYCEAGMIERADEIIEEAVIAFPEDLWIAHRRTVVAQRKTDWAEALRRADNVWKRFPDHPIGYVLRGEVLRDLGQLDEADAAFAVAIKRFPDDEWALRGYAELASRRRVWIEALERWRATRERFPNLVRAQMGLAEALMELNRPDEARVVLDDVVAREPENTEAHAIRSVLASRPNPQEIVVQEVRERGIETALPERVANPVVFIEITSICNFACTYCVSPMKLREKKQMSMDTFRQVMEQVSTITTKPVRLHIDGEPTSHPQFKEMALLVNSYGLPLALATNGSRLDTSFLDIWMDPLISMSTSPEELAERHNKLDFDAYIDRIANYATAWSRSQARQNVFFQIVHYAQKSPAADAAYKSRKDAFLIEFCRRAGLYETCREENSVQEDNYRFTRKGHPGALSFIKQVVMESGLYPLDGKLVERERATAGFCDSPWRQLVVHSNGTLGACCVDLSGGTNFATAEEVETTSIKELWESSPQIKRLRQSFLEGRVERDVCQRCLTQGQVTFLSAHQ